MNTSAEKTLPASLRRLLPYVLVLVPSMVLLFGQLGALGIWEPWEAQHVLVAMEYSSRAPFDPSVWAQNPSAPGYNWAVPTLDGKPVAESLLKTWLIASMLPEAGADVREVVGRLEQGARIPFALLALALVLGAFAWMRKRFSTLQAAISSLALVSMPAIYLGAHNLTTPLLFVVTTSAALLALFELQFDRKKPVHKWALSLLFTLSLALCVFDQRLISLLLVLAIFAGYALSEIPSSSTKHTPLTKRDALISAAIFCFPGLVLLYLYLTANSYTSLVQTLSAPHAGQLLMLCVPITSITAALYLARKTRAVRTLLTPQALLPWVIAGALVLWLGDAYGEINPALTKRGELSGAIPSLTYLLGDHVHAQSLAREHYRLDLWLRQVGFATFPWVALIPAGLAHLARNLKSPQVSSKDQEHAAEDEPHLPEIERDAPRAKAQRFLLAWAFIALFFMAAASTQDHYFYPAYVPLAAACGVLLGDVPFWAFVRRSRPIYPYLVGMTAVAIILTLGKDLERYPHRFIEVYAEMPKKLELPEGFSWGESYKPMKYVMLLTLIAGFFGPTSWLILQLEAIPDLKRRWRALRAKEGFAATATRRDSSPLEERSIARAALIEGESRPKNVVAKPLMPIARILEHPRWRALLVALIFVGFGVMTLFDYIHEATYHLSQRHIFESYMVSSDEGEQLYTYQAPKNSNALYLRDIEGLSSTRDFTDKISSAERFYAVVPREKLATLNMYARQKLKKNLHVLNANSDKLVLVSNQLEVGEEDENFIAERILEPSEALPEEIQHPLTFKTGKDGQETRATFDDQLELLGYSLNREGARNGEGVPVYKWGDEVELTLYFRVKARVPGNQQFFVHFDTQGNRLHGDHYPLDGDFPTNTWLPGDIVKDVHTVPVESYSKVGRYSLGFGFYQGKKRMSVKPKSAHRDNRVVVGEIRVER